MANVKFMLVTENFLTFIVTTPFTNVEQLSNWLDGIRGNEKFADDPIAWLPPGSFANMLLAEEEVSDLRPNGAYNLIEDDRTWKDCHGTLMVDDNDSVFYWVRDSKNAHGWKLPSLLLKGA